MDNRLLKRIAKRVLDVTFSSIGLLLLSPLLIIVAILIKIDSPNGPIIFNQMRVGLNGKVFRMYKFRSMIPSAEKLQILLRDRNQMSGPVFKIKDDPRVTRIGRFIRKTSIDELPQLFNVLKGDMSLVGPRPLPVNEAAQIDEGVSCRRQSVKPGITCLWQISGRNGIDFEEWMEMDMKYISNWSLWLDLKIIFLTVPAVLSAKGAN